VDVDQGVKRLGGRALAGLGATLMAVGGVVVLGGIRGNGTSWVIIGTIMGGCGVFLQSFGRRMAVKSAKELQEEDPRPPILLLRSFEDDGNWGFDVKPSHSPLVPYSSLEQVTFEQVIKEEFAKVGPLVAIGRPGESLPPLGAARTWVNHDEWQPRVTEYLRSCGLVVMMVGKIKGEDGLAWELKHVLDMVTPEKIILVVPPIVESEVCSRWAAFHERAGGRLPPYEGGEMAVGFQRDWRCIVIRDRARRPAEYREALKYLLRPESRWMPLCVFCSKPIDGPTNGRVCSRCFSPVHFNCMQPGAPDGTANCKECGNVAGRKIHDLPIEEEAPGGGHLFESTSEVAKTPDLERVRVLAKMQQDRVQLWRTRALWLLGIAALFFFAAAAFVLSRPSGHSWNPLEVTGERLLEDFDRYSDNDQLTMLLYYSDKTLRVRMRPDTVTQEGDRLILRQHFENLGELTAKVPAKDADRVSPMVAVTLVGTIHSGGRGKVELGDCSVE
jgi:hypothetical protein